MNRKEKILRYEEEIQKKEEAKKEFEAKCDERIQQLKSLIKKEKAVLKKEEDEKIAAAVRAMAQKGEDIDSVLARILGSKEVSAQENNTADEIVPDDSYGVIPDEISEKPWTETSDDSWGGD